MHDYPDYTETKYSESNAWGIRKFTRGLNWMRIVGVVQLVISIGWMILSIVGLVFGYSKIDKIGTELDVHLTDAQEVLQETHILLELSDTRLDDASDYLRSTEELLGQVSDKLVEASRSEQSLLTKFILKVGGLKDEVESAQDILSDTSTLLSNSASIIGETNQDVPAIKQSLAQYVASIGRYEDVLKETQSSLQSSLPIFKTLFAGLMLLLCLSQVQSIYISWAFITKSAEDGFDDQFDAEW